MASFEFMDKLYGFWN